MLNIDAIAKAVAERIIATVDANTADYAEDLMEDHLVDQAVEYVCEGTPLNPDDLYETMAEHREIELALETARAIVEDWKSDQDLYKHGEARAIGLRQSDFV